ncbi:MAG: prefoldin subunit beta [Methanomassiliicoccales archaeon]|jgi:prefoldin beta subunit|nr:prefoldin subunit beta [Methanomassiliicoccales archaeon]
MDDVSPKIQNQIAQFQQLQQQLQAILGQKYQMEAQLKEMERTIEELNKTTEDFPIYKSVGSLLIKAKDKDSVLKEIEDDKESTGVRIKTLERQEKYMRDRYQSLQDQLSKALGVEQKGQEDTG